MNWISKRTCKVCGSRQWPIWEGLCSEHFVWDDDNRKVYARYLTTFFEGKGMIKRLPCEVYGEPDSHIHHDNYRLPLLYRWICIKHHIEAHGGVFNGPDKVPAMRDNMARARGILAAVRENIKKAREARQKPQS